ncbi:MAG: DUF6442 family protein [Solobacterium sp.]|jgi:hypothetical protein|nr:DUF6442 family protein [Solobacterium sp.]MCH4048333.1 DUF6442 family protein [Solobacterium sp.]MCH4074815.1 DUF6442 family protein [Solobacterium sp.]
MKDDDILKIAQKDKSNDEYERTKMKAGDLISFAITILVGVIMMLIEYFSSHRLNMAIICILATSLAASYLFEGHIYKKKRDTIVGIISAFIAVVSFLVFLKETI